MIPPFRLTWIMYANLLAYALRFLLQHCPIGSLPVQHEEWTLLLAFHTRALHD